jgi:hypothetical protein
MQIYDIAKHGLKTVRWRARRAAAARRWGAAGLEKMPALLGNAMPKSGSHLIIQVLQGLTGLGPFVNPGFPPVNRSESNRKLPQGQILANIRAMRPGDIGYGYLRADPAYIAALTAPGRATVFIYRDPRDMIVSHVFYATQMHTGHGMHRYYNEVLSSMEERIDAAIRGVEDPEAELHGVRQKYEDYLGWLATPGVLSLRFEDLILKREQALGCLLDYLAEHGFIPSAGRAQAILALQQAIAPKRSGTFRKGKPGNWREHFTETNKAVFKEQTGDLLLRMGYEQDLNW